MNSLFYPADILVPAENIDMQKWSVIACDQHSSEKEYWDELDRYVGNDPSTLRMMLPEAYLDRDPESETEKINNTMRQYLDTGVFRTLENSYVYVERTLSSGSVRKGLIGALCLDQYDYSRTSSSPVRATEGTVEERLPARIKIRENAALEMPHVMVFVNDPENILFSGCSDSACKSDDVRKVYDFELNFGGGHLKGWQIPADSEIGKNIDHALCELEKAPMAMAIGDGNHSLAAAKKSGSKYALVELVNIHDEAVSFEPIHRVIFHTDPKSFSDELEKLNLDAIADYAKKISAAEEFCQSYIRKFGGEVDYIHNDETAIEMGEKPGCAALLLPKMEKHQLFESVEANGPFPKKSFSIGHAEDKRYYLECRCL